MRNYLLSSFLFLGLFFSGAGVNAAEDNAAVLPFVPPATPLVTCDPYFSVWSTGRKLTDVETTHWTGRQHRLVSLIRVDGITYRLMGGSKVNATKDLPIMKQVSLKITPTRSIYQFEGAGLVVDLTFMTPALPEDIDMLSRPITYITYQLRATDGQQHNSSIFFLVSGELAVNTRQQLVTASQESFGEVTSLKIGSVEQPILGRAGDDLRIDWGYLHLAAKSDMIASKSLGGHVELIKSFMKNGEITKPNSNEIKKKRAGKVSAAFVLDTKTVGTTPVSQWLVLAYDDLYSIEFMYSQLRPYWRRNGLDAKGLLEEAVRDYDSLVTRCQDFDKELMNDLEEAGGIEYARLAALAFRQCFAAGKFVADANGQPIQFSKENNSNGCIATSDVFYPMSPQFLLFGPSLAKSFVVPFMEYAASDRWKFPFAPHDLGTYPKANGQVYGGGETSVENQMPVEESGNMLILMAAIAKLDGNTEFADRYWPQLEQWANYLKQEGFDPDNQLCTDDFAGHLAHNVNLSAKAICGLGAFAQLCEMRGDQQMAQEYRATAEEFAAKWIKEADAGDHFRLAFDKPKSWSQKYNLVWDRVLGLNLFPDSVLKKEMHFYRRMQNRYGLPLDNRKAYTKLDWILWTATLTQDRDDFVDLVRPVYRFLQESPSRVPMTDWYQTHSGKQVGFKARPVVGGVFMRLLHDDALWKKWAARDITQAGNYAAMPRPPVLKVHLETAETLPAEWHYTTSHPAKGWRAQEYDASAWAVGHSGFGTPNTPSSHVGTAWKTANIWARRTFDFPNEASKDLKLRVHYDEDAEIYINGILACRLRGYSTSYTQHPISLAALETLKPTGNVMAVHCRQTSGGQFIDVGLVTIEFESE